MINRANNYMSCGFIWKIIVKSAKYTIKHYRKSTF